MLFFVSGFLHITEKGIAHIKKHCPSRIVPRLRIWWQTDYDHLGTVDRLDAEAATNGQSMGPSVQCRGITESSPQDSAKSPHLGSQEFNNQAMGPSVQCRGITEGPAQDSVQNPHPVSQVSDGQSMGYKMEFQSDMQADEENVGFYLGMPMGQRCGIIESMEQELCDCKEAQQRAMMARVELCSPVALAAVPQHGVEPARVEPGSPVLQRAPPPPYRQGPLRHYASLGVKQNAFFYFIAGLHPVAAAVCSGAIGQVTPCRTIGQVAVHQLRGYVARCLLFSPMVWQALEVLASLCTKGLSLPSMLAFSFFPKGNWEGFVTHDILSTGRHKGTNGKLGGF